MDGRVEVRTAADRFLTSTPSQRTWHSFSFGEHYDPANVGFGALAAHNEELLAPGAGFDPHPHRDSEIVTWVLEGSLRHEDTQGNRGVLGSGSVQLLSAGSGVTHSERNAAADRPVRFVQMWLTPDRGGGAVAYEQRDLGTDLASGSLVAAVSGRPQDVGTVRIGVRDAVLHLARLSAGQRVRLPVAPYVHVFVARGAVDLEGVGRLAPSDAARLTAAGDRRLTATAGPAEVLVWQLPAPPAHGDQRG
jgi:redox-sensitive bicupin YhaK (pirin superfamily)